MTDFLSKVIIGIVSAVAGAIAILLFKEIVASLKSKDSELSGDWIQLVYDKNGDVIRKDKVECFHVGNRLKGKIKRIKPSHESYKEWTFEGYFLDDLFFATFQTLDRKKNPGSYGTLQLHKVIQLGQTSLEGYYVKSELQIGTEKGDITRSIKQVNLKWERPE